MNKINQSISNPSIISLRVETDKKGKNLLDIEIY